MMAALTGIPGVSRQLLVNDKNVLHFAPESIFQKQFMPRAKEYRTADLFRPGVDLKLDMCEMPEVSNDSVDLIIACDVLEHVPDDGEALDELHRILRTGGWAILTVPQKDGLETTFEDPSITSEVERLEVFGQEDHLRIYGDDFPEILKAHQFRVTTIDEDSFPAEQVSSYVLFPPILSPHPLATNYRKVFFAQKVQA